MKGFQGHKGPLTAVEPGLKELGKPCSQDVE